MTLKKIILFFLTALVFPTNSAPAQQSNKLNFDSLLVGKWVKKIDKTKDGNEYFGLKCKDTIQYLKSGNYIWNICGINETGKWKISKDKKKIILYQRRSKYWEDNLNTKDIGQMNIPIVSMTHQQLVTIIYSEEKGAVNQYYSKTK